MLTTLEAYSSWKSVPVLPLSDGGLQTDLLQIRSITGLGPVASNVNTTPFGSVDGESYTGTSVPKRNIVITVGLNPDWADWSTEALRRLLYSYFMPKQVSRLVFRSDDDFPPVEISGYVESVEPNIFSKDPEIQISIICPDPYFTAVSPTVVTGIVNDLSRSSDGDVIDYKGSIESGINLKLTYSSGLTPTSITIQVGAASLQTFRVVASVSATKYFVANSLPGQKYVQNVELGSGLITNLLNKIDQGYTWPTLQPGLNDFSVITDRGIQDWELTYFERFGGL